MSSPSVFETLSPNRLFLRCALPNMISMAASSLYTIADGIFVGRFLGEEALAAVNLVMPFLFIGFVFSDMVAVGSSVQIAIHLGEHREREASVIFTRCSLLIEAIALAVGVLGFFFARPLLELMGADPSVTQLACQYLQVFALFTPAVMIYFAVDNYLRICGLTRYSMVLNVTASLLNIGLDYLFLAVFRWGIASAALASCLSLALGSLMGLVPLIGGKLPLRFVKGRLRRGLLKNILYNGSSEFFTNISGSLLMIIVNSLLLHLEGSRAVAAFSIVMYVDSVTASLLYGLADSMQPAISYCYGARLSRRMLAFEKRVLLAGALISSAAFLTMRLGGRALLPLFVGDGDPALIEMSLQAMTLFSFSYLTGWAGVGLSSFFTAVDRPALSLGLSLGRSLIFPLLILACLVPVLGLDGVWLTSPFSSLLTALACLFFLRRFLSRPEELSPD